MTTWCHTSSIVSHEAKKLHANTIGEPFRGARAFSAWITPDDAEDQAGPSSWPSSVTAAVRGGVKPTRRLR